MSNVAAAAVRAPDTRDRFVDFLRVASLGGVVVGHFLMAAVVVHGSNASPPFEFTNIQAVEPLTRGGTWLFQVVPVFFAVGGFVHAQALCSLRERGGGYADFVYARFMRLMRPTLLFLGVWLALSVVISMWSGEPHHIGRVLQVLGEPLWFLGIYLAAVACAPLMWRWHEQWGAKAFAVLVVAIVGVDVARLVFDVPHVMWLNVVVVWLTIHQCGFFYADAVVDRAVVKRLGAAMVGVGALSAALLIGVGPYGVAMVAYPGEGLSNHIPPTVVLLMFALLQLGLLLMARETLMRWLQRARVWKAVIAGGAVAMTAYLWHFTALVGMYLMLYLLEIPAFPEPGSASWWWWRLPLLVAFCVLVAALVWWWRRWDFPPHQRETTGPSPLRSVVAGVGVLCGAIGMVGFAGVGFRGVLDGYTSPAGLPLSAAMSAGLVVLSAVLLRSAVAPRTTVDTRA